MGLIFAKFYIRKMDQPKNADKQSISLNYNGNVIRVGLNEEFHDSVEEFISVRYKGNKIQISYGDEDSIVFTIKDDMLMFTILKGQDVSTEAVTVDYTWLHRFKGIYIVVKDKSSYINYID